MFFLGRDLSALKAFPKRLHSREDRGRPLEFTSTIKQNYEFRRLYSKGKSCANAYLVVYCRKNRAGRSRIGYTVSNKVGHAVVRNRIRRRLREIYCLHERQIARGYDLVVVSRVRARTADYHQLEAAFLSACAQLGLLTEGDDGV
ncbi:Riibonuclease P [human gut metagenome]|uniref:Riibonuclease P n=1 Tax=human gut metagenome TaxID=408170 RepID=K1TBY3_9ZZZZ